MSLRVNGKLLRSACSLHKRFTWCFCIVTRFRLVHKQPSDSGNVLWKCKGCGYTSLHNGEGRCARRRREGVKAKECVRRQNARGTQTSITSHSSIRHFEWVNEIGFVSLNIQYWIEWPPMEQIWRTTLQRLHPLGQTDKTWRFLIPQRWLSTRMLPSAKARWARGKFPIPPTSRTRRSCWAPRPPSPAGRATSSRRTPSPSTSEAASGPWTRTRTDTDHRWSRAPSGSWRPHPIPCPVSTWARWPPRCRPRSRRRVTSGSPWCPASAPPCRSTSVLCGTRTWWVCFVYLQL